MAANEGTGDGTGTIFSFTESGDGGDGDKKQSPANNGAVDPASLAGGGGGSDGSGTGKRGRGRPRKDGAATGAKAAPLDLGFVEFALVGIHTFLAGSLQIPELELQDEEAKKLAVAVANVGKYYNVKMDAKTQAWMGLIMCAGGIYGGRAVAIYARMNTDEKPKGTEPGASNVQPLFTAPPTPH